MNSKKMKMIRYKAKHILVEWLRSLLSKEEGEKITFKNVLSFLPNKTHYYQGSTMKLQPWSFKWIIKKLKYNSELTYEQLNDMLQPTAKLLLKNRKEVEINGNGTSGYKIKEGVNKDKVLAHIKIKEKDI